MIGLFWGLLGALFIGVSDGLARKTTQSTSILVLILIVMGLSSLILTGVFSITGNWPQWHLYAWTASALSGLLNLVALAFLYKALHRGPVAVASPSASSFTVMLVVINAFMGHPFHWGHMLAVALVFIGVVMLTQPGKVGEQNNHYSATWLRTTAYFGLGAALAISVRFYLAQEANDILGSIPALYLNRVFAFACTVIVLFYMVLKQGSPKLPKGHMWWLVLIQALLESLALWAFLTGSVDGGRIAATIGFAAFAAITTITAWLLFGEKVPVKRWLWIAVIALGITIASAL
ncbi:MAG: DMT family transporter [Gammaproteobacteria bacterium]|nr:DMT family transporter [Gammaproteobacteria bacterium]MCP4880311.1 DMT family transporter [Gammaproteobacteria bacterium]